MKKMIAFEMDDQPVYVEAEVSEMEMQRVKPRWRKRTCFGRFSLC